MAKKNIIPLATALAALSGAVPDSAISKTSDVTNENSTKATDSKFGLVANVFYSVGEDLLGLVVTKQADGTILAQHVSHTSHSSHSSHSSHRSHTSSRY